MTDNEYDAATIIKNKPADFAGDERRTETGSGKVRPAILGFGREG
jgi:hypothetical protein